MHIYPSSPNSSSPPPSFPSEEIAAIKIQSGFRGYRVRKQLHCHTHRRPNLLLNRHTTAQQRKRPVLMDQFSSSSSSTSSPPPPPTSNGVTNCNGNKANNHGSDARRGVENVSPSSPTIEDKSATKIQAGVRGFLVRKKQKIATDAATKIQAGYRGFKARKEVQKIKQL